MASPKLSNVDVPTIPTRHPGRRTRYKTLTRLTSKQYDLWEHAALLHHGYEWQAAAESFKYLSHVIIVDLESHLCLLNAALTFARLGDYSIAAEILECAAQVEEVLPFTLYLTGHIELQLEERNIDKAKDCFAVALHRLDSAGGSHSYNHLGLDFTLRSPNVKSAIEMLTVNGEDLHMLRLGAIPANGIFEAPTRTWNESSTSVNTMSTSTTTPVLKPMDSAKFGMPQPEFSSSSSDDNDYSAMEGSISGKSTTRSIWRQRAAQLDLATLTDSYHTLRKDLSDAKREFIEELSTSSKAAVALVREQSHRRIRSKASIRVARSPPPPMPVPPIPIQIPIHRRRSSQPAPLLKINKDLPPTPRARMIPRDARGRDESTTTLAHFIKNLPSQNAKLARDAEAHFGEMREMGDFLRDSSPPTAVRPATSAGPTTVARPPIITRPMTAAAAPATPGAMTPTGMPATIVPIPLLTVRNVKTFPSPLHSSYAASAVSLSSTSSTSSKPESVASSFLRGENSFPRRGRSETRSLRERPTPPKSKLRYCRSATSLNQTVQLQALPPPPVLVAVHPALRAGFSLESLVEDGSGCEIMGGSGSGSGIGGQIESGNESSSESETWSGQVSPLFELEANTPERPCSPVSELSVKG